MSPELGANIRDDITKITQNKMESGDESILFFWKPFEVNGYLSNWSPHVIKNEGIEFKTVEHFFMYHKAILMGDEHTAKKILLVRTPQEAKALGRLVQNFDEEKWDTLKEGVMVHGLWLKATQHSEVKDLLLATCGKKLAEASPFDKIWGIGMSKDDKNAHNPNKWRGKNLLGKSWMKARGLILID